MTLDQKDADFSEEELRLTYAVVNLVVDHLLRRGVSVVVDGVYRSTRQRDAVLDIARAYDANVTAFCTRCPDDEVIRRLELRQASSTESPGGVRTYLATKSRFDDPAPNFVVLDTARSISEITRAAMAEIDMTRAAMAR
jgi:predicted kinase